MSNLFRWQYVVPRVLAILVALLAFQYGLCLLGRARVMQGVSKTVGAKSEVTAARVSFVDGRVTLGELRVADPRRPLRNLLAADLCDFTFDTGLYLRRRTLVGNGDIRGLQFLTPRETSGALTGAAPWPREKAVSFGEQDSQAVVAWLKEIDGKFAADAPQPCESLQLTSELAGSGAKEVAALEQRMRALESRAEQLRSLAAAADENPLRSGQFVDGLPDKLAAMRAESVALAADLEKLPVQFDAGRRAIVAARLRDDKQLREHLGISATVTQPLAAYLLRDQATQFAGELVGWLKWTRSVMPGNSRPSTSPSPVLLLHTLAIDSTANVGGKPLALRGTISDFTTEPWLIDRPIQLRLTSADATAVDIRASIDRSGKIARDELLVDCKALPISPLTLGQTEGLRLSLGESTASLNVSVQLKGEDISGEIQIVQSGVQMATTTGSHLGHVPLAATLQETLGEVHSLATRLTLRGTLAEPRVTLWSSIGPVTAKAMDIALRRAADDHANRVMTQTQRRIDERLAQLDRQIAECNTELASRLAASTGEMSQLATQVSAPARLNAERLGRLPAGSLFR